jgi:RNA polymerase sigma-70 factor (ECF subfamily)
VDPRVQARSVVRSDESATGWSDEELVGKAVDGDRHAFESLVRRYQRSLVNHLFRQVGRQDSARDLAQDVFLKVYLSLSSFDPAYRFKTWLYRIASNCAIDFLRKRKPATCSLSHDPRDDRGGGLAMTLAGNGPGPDEVLRLRELQGRLEVAVRKLPADFRQLILLRHHQHCRYNEIARITDLPIGTVKNRIFRARELLRVDLADLLNTDS